MRYKVRGEPHLRLLVRLLLCHLRLGGGTLERLLLLRRRRRRRRILLLTRGLQPDPLGTELRLQPRLVHMCMCMSCA